MDAIYRWGCWDVIIKPCYKGIMSIIKTWKDQSCCVVSTQSTFFLMLSSWVKLCRAQYSRERETKACTTQTERVRTRGLMSCFLPDNGCDTSERLRRCSDWAEVRISSVVSEKNWQRHWFVNLLMSRELEFETCFTVLGRYFLWNLDCSHYQLICQ